MPAQILASLIHPGSYTSTHTMSFLRSNILLIARPLSNSSRLSARQLPFSTTRAFGTAKTGLFSPKSPRLTSNFFKSSRTIFTKSTPVIARPTQSEAWRRYAITAVCPIHCQYRNSTLICYCIGDCSRYCSGSQRLLQS